MHVLCQYTARGVLSPPWMQEHTTGCLRGSISCTLVLNTWSSQLMPMHAMQCIIMKPIRHSSIAIGLAAPWGGPPAEWWKAALNVHGSHASMQDGAVPKPAAPPLQHS